jgi:hypothetical protein
MLPMDDLQLKRINLSKTKGLDILFLMSSFFLGKQWHEVSIERLYKSC